MKKVSFCAFVVALAACGCGQKELPVRKTYPVQGTITYKGEPVAFAIVTFEPKEKGSPATAFTDKDGVFKEARTYSNTEMDGMVPGEYEVKLEGYGPTTASKFMGTRPEEGEKPTVITPEIANSGQIITVEAGDNNQITIDIK